jgi:transposase
MPKKSISMDLVNPHAAGIDVGSRSHYVVINQNKDDVREFGVYAEDL